MKKNIIIGILTAIILMGFTGVESGLITVKPAMPKSIVVLTGTTIECKKEIASYYKQGYVVKTQTQSQGEYVSEVNTHCLIVMEKY